MQFRPEGIEAFKNIFDESYPLISKFPGCAHLELLRDKNNPCILFTHSHWDSEESLESYRSSPLFKSTWAKTKAFFAEKAEAWSLEKVD